MDTQTYHLLSVLYLTTDIQIGKRHGKPLVFVIRAKDFLMTDTLYIAHKTGPGLQRVCLPNILRLRISYDIENKCESSRGQSGSGKKTDNSALN